MKQSINVSINVNLTSHHCVVWFQTQCHVKQPNPVLAAFNNCTVLRPQMLLLNHEQHDQRHQSFVVGSGSDQQVSSLISWLTCSRELPEKPRETTRNIWKFRSPEFLHHCLLGRARTCLEGLNSTLIRNQHPQPNWRNRNVCAMPKSVRQTSKTMFPRNLYQKSDLPTNQTPKAIHPK